jgi:hypothetical protein
VGSAVDLVEEFAKLFGMQPNGLNPEVGHCRNSPRIVGLCREAMGRSSAELFEYFEEWEQSRDGRKPRDIEFLLATAGRWEAAWSIARLHVDQVTKREKTSGLRNVGKGHPLCNVALVGSDVGCRALIQHYGQLSSAGDLYRAAESGPADHGLGPVLLEPHESRRRHEEWREWVRGTLGGFEPTRPLFLEAFLASRWFRGAHAQAIIDLAEMTPERPVSFVDLLLGAAGGDGKSAKAAEGDTTTRGTLFEASAGLLLSATPGFTVYPCRWDRDEQIDLVVRYEPDGVAPPCLPMGYGLVECKAERNAIDSATIRDFGSKCLFHRVQFGILIARTGITGAGSVYTDPRGAELVRRRFLADGLPLLVLDIRQLSAGLDRELRGLHDALFDDYQELVFGRIVGEA